MPPVIRRTQTPINHQLANDTLLGEMCALRISVTPLHRTSFSESAICARLRILGWTCKHGRQMDALAKSTKIIPRIRLLFVLVQLMNIFNPLRSNCQKFPSSHLSPSDLSSIPSQVGINLEEYILTQYFLLVLSFETSS